MKDHSTTPSRARWGLALGSACWFALVLVLRAGTLAAWRQAHRPGADLGQGTAALAGGLALLVLAWVAVAVVTTTAAELLPGSTAACRATRRISDRATPALCRRGLTLMVGAALTVGTGSAAGAVPAARIVATAPSTVTTPTVTTRATTTRPAVDDGRPGRFDPSWPATAAGAADGFDPTWAASPQDRGAVPAARRAVRRGEGPLPVALPRNRSGAADLDPTWGAPGRLRPTVHGERAVVVRRGDSLWDLAARYLGPSATDAEIARAWPRWYSTNRDLIGSDPDLLRPGQRLSPPDPDSGGQR